MKRVILAVSLLLTLPFSGASAEFTKMTVGHTSIATGQCPAWMAKESETFRKNGLCWRRWIRSSDDGGQCSVGQMSAKRERDPIGGSKSSHSTGRNRLECHFAGVVIETNFKSVENARAAEKIKPNAETFGETDRHRDLRAPDFNRDIMNEDRNETTIADDHHLLPALLPVDSHISGLRSIDDAKSSSRIHVDP